MATTSSNRGLQVPTNAGDVSVWGTELIAQATAIDSILGGTITFPSSTFGTNATVTSSQAQAARYIVSGTPGSSFQLNLPASNFALGSYTVNNQSSAQNVIVTAGSSGTGGTTVSVPPATQRQVYADGVNISFADGVLAFPLQGGFAFGFDGGTVAPSSGIKPGVVMPFTFQVQSWALRAWDAVGSMSADLQVNGTTVSTGLTPTLTSTFSATGSASNWSVSTIASNSAVAAFVNSASSAVKFSLTLLGRRIT